MRKTLAIFYLLITIKSYACTCVLPDIGKSYIYSSAIFYGKYLSTDTVENFNDLFGRPFIVDNFEVRLFYRGVDSSRYEYRKVKTQNYIISLISNCQNSCGICFKKNQMYLVYAYRDFLSGHLTTDGCARTREILNDNFTISSSLDPDYGKNELKELSRLKLTDTTEKYLTQYDTDLNFQKEMLRSELDKAIHKLKSRTIFACSIFSVATVIILFLLFRLRRLKKLNNA